MIKFKVNRIIKYLLISDLIFWTGWGLVTPIFAVFVVQRVQGGDALVAGVASAIYSALLAILRVPMGIFLDNQPDQKKDFLFTSAGLFIASLVSFGFIFAVLPWQVYLLQAIHAIGMAMNLSGFSALFTRNIDKGREATEFGIDATVVSIGSAISAVIGGWIVVSVGYGAVFALVGVLGLAGSLALFFIRGDLDKNTKRGLYFSLKELVQKGMDSRS